VRFEGSDCVFCDRTIRGFIVRCRYCEADCHEHCVIHHEDECPDRAAWEKEQDEQEGYYEGDKWVKGK